MKIPHTPDQPAADGPIPTPVPESAPRPNQAGAGGSWPPFERELPNCYLKDVERLEQGAKRGRPIPRPETFPEDRWAELNDHQKAEIAVRDTFGEEDWAWKFDPCGSEPAGEGPRPFTGIPEQTWKDYKGPQDRLPRPRPLTEATAYGSLTDQAAATATANAWSLVAYERQRWAHANFGQLAPSFSNADAARLHGVQTDGPRGYLWIICDEEDLAAYIAAGLPVWGTILGAPACVVLQGDVQGMPGAGEFGHAAERIGRLIRFRNV